MIGKGSVSSNEEKILNIIIKQEELDIRITQIENKHKAVKNEILGMMELMNENLNSYGNKVEFIGSAIESAEEKVLIAESNIENYEEKLRLLIERLDKLNL